MSSFDSITDDEFTALLSPIWDFLIADSKPEKADVIFVFGGLDMKVPQHAAALFKQGFSDVILISGKSGLLSKDRFNKPEALVFLDEVIASGVPERATITEIEATNTLENIRFGTKALAEKGIELKSALLVAKPFLMRRCLATFQKQAPHVKVTSCPPPGSLLSYVDRTKESFAERMIGELDRLEKYAVSGDIAAQNIPPTVKVAAEALRQRLVQQKK